MSTGASASKWNAGALGAPHLIGAVGAGKLITIIQ